jgi:hypothetical protein
MGSVDLPDAIRKLASVALKAGRQNELSLIRTRSLRQSDAAIYQPLGGRIASLGNTSLHS